MYAAWRCSRTGWASTSATGRCGSATAGVPRERCRCVTDVPEPLHGTFFVESDAVVETRVTMRTVEAPMRQTGGIDFQDALVGKQVTVFFRDGQIPPASGVVEDIAPGTGDERWSRTYERPSYEWYPYDASGRRGPASGRHLVLRTPKGRSFVDTGMIAHVYAEGADNTVRRRQPVMLFRIEKIEKAPGTVVMTYLTKGISWAPSYRADISNPKQMKLEQEAIIKNELGGIDDAAIELISGFPSVKFSHVTSPLSMRTTWADFFRQLNQRIEPGHASISNVISQRAVMPENYTSAGLDMSAIPTGEGVDLHYQPIGKRTLAEGDSLALTVAAATAPYERIVEWLVPDTRNEWGQRIEEHERRRDPDKYQDAAWDAVRFRNPFKFPMTTGPAAIVANGRFNGQQLSYWVNPGEETILRVTKALSCVAAVVAALGWITFASLRLERQETAARAAARMQELLRLALWRMDSALAPIIAQEAARPYTYYTAFAEQRPAVDVLGNGVFVPGVFVPSPLLGQTSEFFRLYYELRPGSPISSPQVPEGSQRDLALTSGTDEAAIVAAEGLLRALRASMASDRLFAELARVEQQRAATRYEALAVRELIDRVCERLSRRAEEAGMTLDVAADDVKGRMLHTDRQAVEQILYNLVDNACKYAADGPDRRLHLHAAAGARRLELLFFDHGPGIPASEEKWVFEAFHRGSRETAGPAPGIGLGLALARGLARELGGDLKLLRRPDAGAAFLLTLPIR